MVFETTTLIKRNVYRQATEPGNVKEGDLWIDTSGNNNEMNQYTGATWELVIARGPDTPAYPVEGSLWRDTTGGSLKVYDGAAFAVVGVTDHTQLSGVTVGQHHAPELLMPNRSPVGSSTSSFTTTQWRGLEVNPNVPVSGILIKVFGATVRTNVQLYDSGGTVLDSATVVSDWAFVQASLSAATTYYITMGDGSNQASKYNNTVSYPYSFPEADIITAAIYDGSTFSSNTNWYEFAEVHFVADRSAL